MSKISVDNKLLIENLEKCLKLSVAGQKIRIFYGEQSEAILPTRKRKHVRQ